MYVSFTMKHQTVYQSCAILYSHQQHLVQFSRSVVSDSATPWTAACQASLSINSQRLLKLMSIESVMPSNHLILCHHFSSCPQSFPVSGSFQMSQLFASGGQSIGVSASTSVLYSKVPIAAHYSLASDKT